MLKIIKNALKNALNKEAESKIIRFKKRKGRKKNKLRLGGLLLLST